MTLREQIQSRIKAIDDDIEGARAEIRVFIAAPLWDTPGRIHEQTTRISVSMNRIFARLHERRACQNLLKLVEFHVSKHPAEAAEIFGI